LLVPNKFFGEWLYGSKETDLIFPKVVSRVSQIGFEQS
jgi:hypothetical protein